MATTAERPLPPPLPPVVAELLNLAHQRREDPAQEVLSPRGPLPPPGFSGYVPSSSSTSPPRGPPTGSSTAPADPRRTRTGYDPRVSAGSYQHAAEAAAIAEGDPASFSGGESAAFSGGEARAEGGKGSSRNPLGGSSRSRPTAGAELHGGGDFSPPRSRGSPSSPGGASRSPGVSPRHTAAAELALHTPTFYRFHDTVMKEMDGQYRDVKPFLEVKSFLDLRDYDLSDVVERGNGERPPGGLRCYFMFYARLYDKLVGGGGN